jgi:serine-type anaerobic sulfatase-maturating enzyme
MPNMSETSRSEIPEGIHALAKPVGSSCNIRCDYCFYLEKENLYPAQENLGMPDEVMKAYIKNYIHSQPAPDVEFVWHGGEPTLRGIDFYRRVVLCQKPYLASKKISNSIQTNGTLLTDEWCEFFKQNGFLVGLSLDGPEDIHDRYRRNRAGQPTFRNTVRGLGLLKKWGVAFNVLACVGRETACRPLDVYHFLKEQGAAFIQFTPVIERLPDQKAVGYGLRFAMPSALEKREPNTQVTSWTVEPEKYGEFLIAIFDEWVRKDVGKVFVMNFEWVLNAAMGYGSPICVFARQCGRAVAVEHNGDVYACDHYVYPEYRLGNLLRDNLAQMVQSSVDNGFGPHKENTLPRCCRECDVLKACWGGCPKHRFMQSPQGEPGLHYLCAGYKNFFRHSAKYMIAFRKLIELDLEPAYIMRAVGRPLVIPPGEKTGHRQVVLWIK